MSVRIQIRRDTAANWTSANPVLAAGEPAQETDTKRRKTGDGTTAWTSLAYDLPALATVATTGSYADLAGKPAIPSQPSDIGAQPAGSYATTTSVTSGLATKADASATTTALSGKADAAATTGALAAKADLVGGVIPTAQIPALALVDTVVVASQAAMLALTTSQVQKGDIAVRTDGAGTFVLTSADPSQLASWVRLNAPTDVVTTVNGQQGTVVLAKSDIGLANVDNTSDASKPVSAAQAAAFGLAPTATKTAAYTVASGELAMMNVSAGATALTLPTAPADKTRVAARAIGATATTPLTVTAGGSDTIGDSGATTATLPLSGETTVWQYLTAATRWLSVDNVKPLTALDARYPVTTGGKVLASQIDTAGVAADPALSGAYQLRRIFTAADVFPDMRLSSATIASKCVGVGAGGAIYYVDSSAVRRSPNAGGTLTAVGAPTNAVLSSLFQLYEWKGYVYGIFQDSSDSGYKLYRAPITTGTTALAWSTALFTLTSGATGLIGTNITGTSTALLVGEYGDPLVSSVKAAHIWRSTDGTTFTTTKTLGSTARHIHCVGADPYNDGSVWASFGDNVPNCYTVSSDHGTTWTDITCDATWQGVQISFSKDWVYVAPDAGSHASLFVIDRATRTPRVGTFGNHRSLPIIDPGTYTNGSSTNGSTTFTTSIPDYAAVFVAADKGRKIFGTGIPDGTTIATVNAANSVTLSAAATATATGVTFTIDRAERPKAICYIGVVDPATGIYYGCAHQELSTALPTAVGRNLLFAVPYVGGPVLYLAALNVIPPAIFIDTASNIWAANAYRSSIPATYSG